jgi:L-2,4-diaminobutyric acid acetyltransferase
MQQEIDLRPPVSDDGISVFRLIQQCPPLDPNSIYCNLLQCSHFAGTSVAAVWRGELVGFVSGYLVPERADTLFVWQVAVGKPARGKGLASSMLRHILNRSQCRGVSYIETTITESNEASWALFERLAQQLNAELKRSVMFDREKHFAGRHDTEMLVRIGPFN